MMDDKVAEGSVQININRAGIRGMEEAKGLVRIVNTKNNHYLMVVEMERKDTGDGSIKAGDGAGNYLEKDKLDVDLPRETIPCGSDSRTMIAKSEGIHRRSSSGERRACIALEGGEGREESDSGAAVSDHGRCEHAGDPCEGYAYGDRRQREYRDGPPWNQEIEGRIFGKVIGRVKDEDIDIDLPSKRRKDRQRIQDRQERSKQQEDEDHEKPDNSTGQKPATGTTEEPKEGEKQGHRR